MTFRRECTYEHLALNFNCFRLTEIRERSLDTNRSLESKLLRICEVLSRVVVSNLDNVNKCCRRDYNSVVDLILRELIVFEISSLEEI